MFLAINNKSLQFIEMMLFTQFGLLYDMQNHILVSMTDYVKALICKGAGIYLTLKHKYNF